MPRISAATLEAHHDRTWSAIVDGLEACLAVKPYEEISLAEIAARAGIARNTIYNYAKDKASLTTAAIAHSGETLLADMSRIAGDGRSVRERLVDMVGALFKWVASGHRRATLGYAITRPPPVSPDAESLFGHVFGRLEGVIQEGVREGVFRPDTALTLELLNGVAQMGVRRVYYHPEDFERVHEEAVRLLLAGLERR